MVTIILITLLLLIIAAAGKAVCDIIKSSLGNSIFKEYRYHKWIDPGTSWKNKWKNGDPKQGERFFGSSTFLVWITDLWHFAQLIWLNSYIAGIVIFVAFISLPWWGHFLILATVFKVLFEFSYRIMKRY